MVPDSSFLWKYKTEIDKCFRVYKESINPLIVELEVHESLFPVQIQNEIRAIYAHLTRAAYATTEEEAAQNVAKMWSHTKRALLDCYKNICISRQNRYEAFFERYRNVDMSIIENGRFLQDVLTLYGGACESLLTAKEEELENAGFEEQIRLYETAYIAFDDLAKRLDSARTTAEYLSRKAVRKAIADKVSIGLGIFGAIGVVFTIIGFFL